MCFFNYLHRLKICAPTGLQNLVPEFDFMMAYFYVPGKMKKKKAPNCSVFVQPKAVNKHLLQLIFTVPPCSYSGI